MKFSIIIPVYNVEKYIDKCLNSIAIQTYKNYEVIIVNDGTKDNSVSIINKYTKEYSNFKLYNKKNGGLSDARNFGLQYVTGDYILFVDSDDYIEKNLLSELNKILTKNKYNLIKFKINLVDEFGKLIRKESGLNVSKEISQSELFDQEFCEPACTYCYSSNFWRKNNFKYIKGMIHEDFGLTPEIIMTAQNIYYLNYFGYNYVQRANSITKSKEKELKKAQDMLKQFDRLINIDYKNNNHLKVYKSFLANSVISKSKTLEGKAKKEYIKELRKRKVFDLLIDDTLIRKIKKLVLKILYRS